MSLAFPNYVDVPVVEKDLKFSDTWRQIIIDLLQNLTNSFTEGFDIPQYSSANNSVTPPTAGGQIQQLVNGNPAPNVVLMWDSHTNKLILIANGVANSIAYTPV